MQVNFNESRTRQNLMRAFAGECQSRQRYYQAALIAQQQKLIGIERMLRFTAEQEERHAMVFWKLMKESAGQEIEITAGYPASVFTDIQQLLDSSAAEGNGDMLTVGELKLDTKKFILYKNGEEIMLTPTEFKILSLFMEKPGMVFTKAQIYQRINGDFYETDDNTMMVHISKLRDKLGDNSKSPTYIKTVRGLGYKIEKKK